MWNDFSLIEEKKIINIYGDTVTEEIVHHVFGDEESVGMREFYQGMTVGFQPEIKITLTNWLDYHGEKIVEYTPFGMTAPIRFTVIRTFRKGEALELTLQRGVDHGHASGTSED